MPALLLILALAQPAASPNAQFESGRRAFERQQFAKAIELLRPLLYPELRLTSEGQVVLAHRMLGMAYVAQRQDELARQEFRKLLQFRPDYRFDTLLDPPEVVDLFNGVLREHEAELAAIEARRREAELREKREREARERDRVRVTTTIVEKPVLRNSFAINFVPFGAGQFQNGQRGKGWAFLTAQLTLGAVSVGALAVNFALYGPRQTIPCEGPRDEVTDKCPLNTTERDRSRLLTQVQVVSGGLFFAAVAWGIADALVNYQPTSPVAMAPLLLDGGGGAALAFRF